MEQRGVVNAGAVLNWTTSQQMFGYLTNPIQELVLMGNSAGAVGSPIWADRVFTNLNAADKAVVPDSFILSMPSDIEGVLLRDSANFCTSVLLPAALQSLCTAGIKRP